MNALLLCLGSATAGVLIGYTAYRYGRQAAYKAARHHLAATGRLPLELQAPPRPPAVKVQPKRASRPPVAMPRPAKAEPVETVDRSAAIFLALLWVGFAIVMAYHLVKAVAA